MENKKLTLICFDKCPNDINSLICENFEYLFVNKLELLDVKHINTDYFMIVKDFNNIDINKLTNAISFIEKNNINIFAFFPKLNGKSLFNNLRSSGNINICSSYNVFLETYIINKKLFDFNVKSNLFELFLINILSNNNYNYYQSILDVIDVFDVPQCGASFSRHFDKEWYLNELELYIKFLSNNNNLNIQSIILYLLCLRLNYNIMSFYNGSLSVQDLDSFYIILKRLLQYIDDSIITDKNIPDTINHHLLFFLLNIKYDKKLKFKYKNNSIFLNDIKVISKEFIQINAINVKENKLVFDCRINSLLKFGFSVLVNGKKIDIKNSNIFGEEKLFGKSFFEYFTFTFEVDYSSANEISFCDENSNLLEVSFIDVPSRLCEEYKDSFWNVKNIYLKYVNKKIVIFNRRFYSNLINEIKYFINVLVVDKFAFKSIRSLFIRSLYYITKLFYKDIWITYDKLYKGGDCGEYLFRYVNDNSKQKMYYIVNKNSKAYKYLSKKYKNILVFGSIKCKFMAFHTSIAFQTDPKVVNFCSFSNYMSKVCRGLLNYDVYCIQHGLSMQDLFHRQNRVFDNTKKYFLASKYEKENLMKIGYGYDKNDLVLTGIPRFDGLKNREENTILLFPTWRPDIASSSISGKVRGYNNNFRNSNYFMIYNNLINNKNLIKIAKKYKYKILFVIHPTLVSNISDYDKNEFVEIVSSVDINVEEVLCKSKIMITDYSGVQYDFAYMRKPIVYYHNSLVPASYGDGAMDYEKNGFGPIAKSENELVDFLLKFIKEDKLLINKYRKRQDLFFEFDDFNSCKRIYEYSKKAR